jgi:hypothetical protein
MEEAVASADAARMKAVLNAVLRARQCCYATLRQETFYRGKVLLLSLFFLALAVFGLLIYVSRLPSQNTLGIMQGAWMALLAGWAGGSFTWLLANRRSVGNSNLDVLREISRWPYNLSRGAIGAVSGLVLFIALTAGVIPSPTEKLFNPAVSSTEMDRALEAFRALASTAASADPKADLAQATARFATEIRSAFQEPGKSVPGWTRSDQEWLRVSGLKAPDAAATYAIRETLRRDTNALWLLLFLCLLAGFSETLAPSLLDASVKKLGGQEEG